jgi:GDPmannose 4,6-dehydratase
LPVALVTGITGQDGGYLAEQLVADGYRVCGAVRPGETPPEHLVALGPALELLEVDLLDPGQVNRLLERADPDEVYNLAGVSSVAQSWDEPISTAQVNGEAVAVVLDQLWQRRDERPVRFLQASSAEIFAGAQTWPQDEQTPLSPRSPYGAAKAYAHHLVQVYRARGLHAVNAILYNHESPRRATSFVTRKITSTVAAIADGSESELVLGNVSVRRDWGWAPEYVAGMRLAVRHSTPGDWVFATGVASTVADFAAAAFAHVGIDDWQAHVRIDAGLTRSADAPALVGDAGLARREFGWVPQVSLAELVGRMVDADRESGSSRD